MKMCHLVHQNYVKLKSETHQCHWLKKLVWNPAGVADLKTSSVSVVLCGNISE